MPLKCEWETVDEVWGKSKSQAMIQLIGDTHAISYMQNKDHRLIVLIVIKN